MAGEKRGNRGQGYDMDFQFYVEPVLKLQLSGVRSVRGIADMLNRSGLMATYSDRWSYGVVYRLLRRGAELGLLLPPQTRREAALNRKRSQEA